MSVETPSVPFLHALEKLEFEKIRERVKRHIVSGLGESLLASCMPITNRTEIERQLTYVTEMRLLLESEDTIPVHDIRDIRESLKRTTIENAFLEPTEFIEILYTLRASRELHAYFQQRIHLVPKLALFTSTLFSDKLLERHIELTIDESGRILDTASKKLRSLRQDIIDKQELLRRQYSRILKLVADKEFTMDDIVTQRDGRMVIPVKSEHKRKVAGVVHSVSQTGQTVFIEPNETLELNNEIISLQYEEQKEIAFILRELTSRIRAALQDFSPAVETLKHLDFLYAKGRYSMEIRGTAPQFSEHPYIRLRNARHPLLMAHHGYERVVPLNVELGGDVSALIISGPNTGGKSVALKTIGLTALMAQCGMHVSAVPGTTMPLCDDVFADIGDDQSLENDLSTFSSHVKNIKNILEQSTHNSLVLIDELGGGTDPNEGSALAMSVITSLIRRGVLTVVTTHHGALKSFAHETPGAQNAGMEFDVDSLRPTYKIHVGIPGSSYAFEIARKLNFPESILRDAKSRMGAQQTNMETLLVALEKSLRESRENAATAREEKNRFEKLKNEYELKLRDANKDAREVMRKAKDESRALLEESRAVVENTIRELREAQQSSDHARAAEEQKAIRKRFDASQKELIAKLSRNEENAALQTADEKGDFHVGERVRIINSGVEGTIVSLSEGNNMAEIQAGALKVKAKVQTLNHVGNSVTKKTYAAPSPINVAPETHSSVDLRGMYGEEAVTAVENFIAESVAAERETIEIIHGKGTGALRTYVHNLLKSHPAVASFRLADWNAGGSGATVVELKTKN